MSDERARPQPDRAATAVAAAERLDDLADTADLMGDGANASRLRAQAGVLRGMAFHELDHRSAGDGADE